MTNELKMEGIKMHMQHCSGKDVSQLVKDFHYSKRDSSAIQHAFTWNEGEPNLFGECGKPMAGVTYSHPVNRHAAKGSIELSRLVRRDDFEGILSQFVAWSLRWLKQNTDFDFVLSYADFTQNHHGGIYQATNFTYVGATKPRMIGFEDQDGNFVHARSANAKFGTSSVHKVLKINPDWKEVRGLEKHLYVYPLKKKIKKVLAENNWVSTPYPKPNNEIA